MNKLDQLTQDMSACQTDMKTLAEKAKSESDKAKQTIYFDAFKAKSSQFADLKSDFEREKVLADTLAEVETTRSEAANLAAKSINPRHPERPDTSVTQDYDRGKSELELCEHFLLFVKGEDIPDRAKDALAAKGNRYDGFEMSLPKSYQKIVGMRGKAIDATTANGLNINSTDAIGYNTNSNAIRTIDPNFIPELLKMDIYQPTLYDMTRPVNVYNGRAKFPKLDQTNAGDFGGVVTFWDSEGDEIQQTALYFQEEDVAAHRMSTLALLSVESLRRSAVDLEGELLTQFRNAARSKMSQAVLFGTGNGQPQGVLNTAGIVEVDRLGANSIEYKDLVNMEHAARIALRAGSRFVAADSAVGHLQGKTDNEGRPLFGENTAGSMRQALIGWPFMVHEYMNATPPTQAYLGKKGDLVFGNWRNYMFGIEENMRVARTADRWFEYDKVGYKLVMYVAGKVVNPSAFVALKEG